MAAAVLPFILILGGETVLKHIKGVIFMDINILISIIELIIVLEIVKYIKK